MFLSCKTLYCILKENAALRIKSKNLLARNQDICLFWKTTPLHQWHMQARYLQWIENIIMFISQYHLLNY